MPFRLPGPFCQVRHPVPMDRGTLARTRAVPSTPLRTDTDDLAAPPSEVTSADQETMRKVRRMRALASKWGFVQAVQALDHYLDGTGTFVEIPASKVQSVRSTSEASHRTKLLAAVQSTGGARTLLALQGLRGPNGRVLAESHWPARVTFTLDFQSGVEQPGLTDDNLTYYGSQIKTVVTIQATRATPPRTYELAITRWRSWVVDNYDWEGDKKFGGDNWLFRWLLPTQRQMNRLQQLGWAKSYPRSSRSWEVADRGQPWTVGYRNLEEVDQDARVRELKIAERRRQQAAEASQGALPDPGPAEDWKGK